MNATRIGLDLAKNVFQVHGVDGHGQVVFKRKLRRAQVIPFIQAQPPCLIAMEACASAHHWARLFIGMGHQVLLIAPQYVKPYVRGPKNDANDAEAICEAGGRPNMRFVAVKSIAQQDQLALHRIRAELVRQRTAKVNQIRGLLAEYGLIVPNGIHALRRQLPEILEEAENGLTSLFRQALEGLRGDLVELDRRAAEMEAQIKGLTNQDPVARSLQSIPGIGPITASALVATVGDAKPFRHGRDLAAWLGLVPGQHASGGKERLLGISKRGDPYLRTLLIHGARAAIRTAANKDDPRSRWITSVAMRRHKNIAAAALANKNARIAWALMTRGGNYDSQHGMKAC